MDRINKEASSQTPIDAIADAMMRAYWNQIRDELEWHNVDPKNPDDHKKLEGDNLTYHLESATEGKCYISSVDTTSILTNKNRRLFKTIFLLSSEVINKGSQFEDVFYHTYFVAQDKNNNWYAASPANHNVNGDSHYATTIVKEKDLETLIKSMSKRDKITFPDSSSVVNALRKNSYSIPKKEGDFLKILEVRKIGKNVISQIQDEFSPMV